MWKKYVPVARRAKKAEKLIKSLKKKGMKIEPVQTQGRIIAKKFWGKLWCDHIEFFSDYSNRLPRGRTYVRNGSVLHLEIQEGKIKAIISGSEIYTVTASIASLPQKKWENIKKRCSGQIGSLLELLQGNLSQHIMEIVADPHGGLFPHELEIDFHCNCLDWASMCKHVAAVLYGVATRLDEQPDLLFLLRGVDATELIDTNLSLESPSVENMLPDQDLEAIFGIEMEAESVEDQEEKTEDLSEADAIEFITGAQIQMFRETLEMSVKEFAQQLSVAPATVYRWEKAPGRVQLRYDQEKNLRELAKVCLEDYF